MLNEFGWTVYAHITPSNKIYIGITGATNPKRRWRGGSGYRSQVFHRAIQKYGWENIQHEVVASGISEYEAKEFEKLLIEKLHSNNPKFGYNISSGGDGVSGFKRSDAFKENQRIRMTGTKRPHKEETKLKIGIANKGKYEKPVQQLSKDGTLIREFKSSNEASDTLGISRSGMVRALYNQNATCGGFKWRFINKEGELND